MPSVRGWNLVDAGYRRFVGSPACRIGPRWRLRLYRPSAIIGKWGCSRRVRAGLPRRAGIVGANNRVRLLIAIPVFNEVKHVEPVLAQVLAHHDQVLLVDDGSTDGTADLLARRSDVHVLRHGRNLGYGQSLIDAFQWAGRRDYDWVITMDCDGQHEPMIIPEFVREIQTDRWDLISGSRYLRPSNADDAPPAERRSINRTITALLNALFQLGITDAFCGFKAHRVAATLALDLDVPGYAFPMQLWPRVARARLRLTELPAPLIYNDPNRFFGGELDDAEKRLRHYLAVLQSELDRPAPPAPPERAASAGVVADDAAGIPCRC